MERELTIWFPNLNIELYDVNRVAFTLFGIDVMWYGIIIALGLLSGYMLAKWNAKRVGLEPEIIDDFLPFAVIWSIVGARIYYVAFSWDSYKDNLMQIFNLRSGGIAIYGAIIGALLYTLYFSHKKGIKFFNIADCAIPGLILGQAIGRYGNFVNREVYGGFTDNIFAMRILLSDAQLANEEILNNVFYLGDIAYIQVHPTFFYESTINFCIVLFLLIYTKYRRFEGEVFLLGMMSYGILRFFVEGIRVDQLLIPNTSIAISQMLGLVIAIVSFVAIVVLNKRNKILKVKGE